MQKRRLATSLTGLALTISFICSPALAQLQLQRQGDVLQGDVFIDQEVWLENITGTIVGDDFTSLVDRTGDLINNGMPGNSGTLLSPQTLAWGVLTSTNPTTPPRAFQQRDFEVTDTPLIQIGGPSFLGGTPPVLTLDLDPELGPLEGIYLTPLPIGAFSGSFRTYLLYDGDTLLGRLDESEVTGSFGNRGGEFGWINTENLNVTQIEMRLGFDGLGTLIPPNILFSFDPQAQPAEETPQQQTLSFEDPSAFETVFGQGSFSGEDSIVSQGNGSLQIAPGYSNIQTPELSTSEFPSSVTGFSVDLFVGSQQPNPFYTGSLQTYIHAPSANIHNRYVGQVQLTNGAQDEFVTHSFSFSPDVVAALAGDVEDVRFRFVLNVNANSGPYFLDNIQLSE